MLFWLNCGISLKLATYLFVLRLSIFCHMLRFPNQGNRGCWSLSQHSLDERQETCWTVASPSHTSSPHTLVPAEQGSGSVSLMWTLLDGGRTAEVPGDQPGPPHPPMLSLLFLPRVFCMKIPSPKTHTNQNSSLSQLCKAWANYGSLGFPIELSHDLWRLCAKWFVVIVK